MAHGENAEYGRHKRREYWSRRLSGGGAPRCPYSKLLTHRIERRANSKEELEARKYDYHADCDQ